jgi:hypothetical protein
MLTTLEYNLERRVDLPEGCEQLCIIDTEYVAADGIDTKELVQRGSPGEGTHMRELSVLTVNRSGMVKLDMHFFYSEEQPLMPRRG